jgi:hypothetical protein
VGRPSAFALALIVVLAWLTTGQLFRFSDSWQLVINTGTTIVTLLLVFLIQNTQNRDAEAVQVKLDELFAPRWGLTTPYWTWKSSRSARACLRLLTWPSAPKLPPAGALAGRPDAPRRA